MKQTTCAFTGHRPEKLPCGGDEISSGVMTLKTYLRRAIEQAIADGYTTFISGMSRGVDMWAAEIVLDLQKPHPFINLHAAVPCKTQCGAWACADIDRYLAILKQAQSIHVLSPTYTPSCMHERNRYMVDHASCLIAVYDGTSPGGTANTVQYAQQQGIEIQRIWF